MTEFGRFSADVGRAILGMHFHHGQPKRKRENTQDDEEKEQIPRRKKKRQRTQTRQFMDSGTFVNIQDEKKSIARLEEVLYGSDDDAKQDEVKIRWCYPITELKISAEEKESFGDGFVEGAHMLGADSGDVETINVNRVLSQISDDVEVVGAFSHERNIFTENHTEIGQSDMKAVLRLPGIPRERYLLIHFLCADPSLQHKTQFWKMAEDVFLKPTGEFGHPDNAEHCREMRKAKYRFEMEPITAVKSTCFCCGMERTCTWNVYSSASQVSQDTNASQETKRQALGMAGSTCQDKLRRLGSFFKLLETYRARFVEADGEIHSDTLDSWNDTLSKLMHDPSRT